MEIHLSPELQSRLDRFASNSGLTPAELVESSVLGYLDELEGLGGMLDARFDDLETGRVKPIDGEAAFAQLREERKTHPHER